MDDIISPIAKLDNDDYNESLNIYYNEYDSADELNGNILIDICKNNLENFKQQSLQASLENLVNNFDSIISECFSSDEKMDSFSPISEKYKMSSCLVDKNQLWLSLTGSVHNTLHLDWKNFKSFQEFKQAVNLNENEDILNQNLDLPDDEELAHAMDHHSLVTACLPCDYEPLKTADEIIEEIDQIMGLDEMELSTSEFISDLRNSDFVGSQEAIYFRKTLLCRPDGWAESLENQSYKELNCILNELEDSIRDFSCLLVEELALREDLEYEKEERDTFVKLIHEIEHKQKMNDKIRSKELNDLFNDGIGFDLKQKRSNSWRSIFSYGVNTKNKNIYNETSRSSENISKTLGVSIPVHQYMRLDRETLIIINQMLHAMLINSTKFNQLFTDYVLNVYAPADELSFNTSLEIQFQ